MGNRSLDDFLASDDGTPDDEAADDEAAGETADEVAADETADDVETATAAVEPAASTYVGRSGECAACGETVARRWHSDDGLVCPDCKEW